VRWAPGGPGEFRMNTQTARCLKIPAVLIFGLLLGWAGDTRLAIVSAQSSQTQTSQAAPPQDASPEQPSTTTPAKSAPASADAAEMTTEEASVPLRVLVNLVPVRVIVRDAKGHAVATLHKEDFQLFQDGKPQIISNFSIETPDSLARRAVPAVGGVAPNPGEPAPPAFLPPSRFVALLFDDALLNQQDLMQARNATDKYLDSSVTPTDRVAIFTVSGRNQLDFTDDVPKLHHALKSLQVDTITAGILSPTDCPPMQSYEADLIQNHHDQFAIDVATSDALVCSASPNTSPTGAPSAGDVLRAQTLATEMAARVEQETSTQTENTLRRMREVLQRLSALPGQRNLVMISPGFLYTTHETEYSEIIDRAIRETVFINTLDARGLYVPDIGPDISQSMVDPNPANAGLRSQWNITTQSLQSDSLASFAEDSGGYAFHNNNDLTEGLKEVAGAPEAYYFLAFVPQNFKYDGRYHTLKVTLVPKEKLAVQARRGYYAPLHGESAADVARRDIDDALFSQEEQHGVPVGLQTQYYKTGADAKLSVLAHVDLARVRFTKADGRNQDDLTVVAAIFDRDGNFVTGTQRVISMKLRDETFQRLSHSGVTVKTSFDLKPGDYVVRLVVRDSNAAALSAENGVVEIPY
jgi:VWFA-related protein